MPNLRISIGTLIINVRSTQNATTPQAVDVRSDWRALRESWTAQKAKTLVRARDLLAARYTTYKNEKAKQQTADWPPHSIFCEKRCCQRSMGGYIRFLRKELKWGRDGHLAR